MGAWARPLRLPLSGGDTGFRLIALVGVGGALAFGPLFFLSELPLAVLGVCVPAIAIWFLAVAAVARAMWSARASDVLVDASGMEILSGPHRGRRFAWDAIARGPVTVRREGRLSLFTIGGEVLARTRHAGEAASFDALAATLRAGASDRAPDAPLGPQVALCVSCGAPLVPAESASVECRFCRSANALPDRVRHVAGAARAGQRVEHAVAQLLRWPPARRVNAWLLASFGSAALGWPFFAACAIYVQAERPSVGLLGLATLLACGSSAGSTFPSLASLGATERRSFELLSARFAAAAPPAPDQPHGCRHCGGPLPDPHGRSTTPAVALCAYCDATNVVGLGLAREARDAREDAETLDQLARRRLALRRKRRLRAVFPVLVLIAGPYHFASVMVDLPCEGAVGSCADEHLGRWCVGGEMTAVRCDGPAGCSRDGLRLFCDQSVTAPGDVCVGPPDAASCSTDGRTMMRCVGDRTALASSCGGPRGCRLEDERIACDSSIASPGDACERDVSACSPDGRALLVCRGDRFEILHPADTCTIAENGRLTWTGAYALVGERCGGEGAACTADDRFLRCIEGRFAPFAACRGPLGCTTEGVTARCDQSLAEVGDPCSGEGAACSVDHRAMLRCEDGAYVADRRCAAGCNVDGNQIRCRGPR